MDDKHTRRIILASTSPRRRELIASLGLPYEFMPSHADESTPETWTPEDIVEKLSLRKAGAILAEVQKLGRCGVIVGSDTIVVLDGKVLGKPRDEEDAFRMLNMLQGRRHQVFTGVACLDAETGRQLVKHRSTYVTMKPLDKSAIRAYIRSGEPSDKAGAYGIQGLGAVLIDYIEGCYFNVVGLPVSLLSDMLSEFGMHVLAE
ncbi:Maf family protein [Paenibacillus sp. JX-17]|uniref:dTTP/UTP pyrophosphatase n=1 Tax=Paenibacillus lacisoli TaxID=3064525 RepID=A0ABT9CC94_9BACL|nr:Maf family protein [Paenibacillus sp. JX-17]MDO7906888.1 Maf family protein [Paenibacillus sp. JX-17]